MSTSPPIPGREVRLAFADNALDMAFPTPTKPRTLVDAWRRPFEVYAVEYLYDLTLGRPSQGLGRWFGSWFVDVRNTEYSAYAKIRGEAYQWKRAIKGEEGGARYMSERSQTYHYYRLALRFGDMEAARTYRQRMRELKITPDNIREMIKRAHPLGMLSAGDRRRFMANLTPMERRSLTRAVRWWRETYFGVQLPTLKKAS